MRFSTEVETVLRKCGWFPGRQVWDLVDKWRREFKELDDTFLFAKAEETLLEFGGLTIMSKLPGIDFLPEAIDIDPSRALGERDRFDHFGPKVSSRLFPVGELEGGMSFITVDEYGRVYHVMDFIMLIGQSFDEALERQILGKRFKTSCVIEWDGRISTDEL
jgi:hypothetical protein